MWLTSNSRGCGLVCRSSSSGDVPLGLVDGPEKESLGLNHFHVYILPSLIEEDICSLCDNSFLISLCDATVVKVVPVSIYLILAISCVCNVIRM